MKDYSEGIKKDVAEAKFLIHDLRIARFINDVIHFHVTLNTDLEIYGIEEVAALHSDDVLELKKKGLSLRKAYAAYSNAVKSFSPPRTILEAAYTYIENIQDVCKLIIDPLWGRFDKMISFLPNDSRSVKGARHYRNDLRWICGVYYRIQHFFDEKRGLDTYDVFDVAGDVEDFTSNVIRGYVIEKSAARVDIYFDALETAVMGCNRHRFRRMLFNLVMNSVDAMSGKNLGILRIAVTREGDKACLTVKDNGSGMTEDKRRQLISDTETLDGELHSLGFVFVRQTVDEIDGVLEIDTELGKGTTIKVTFPYMVGKAPPPRPISKCAKFKLVLDDHPAEIPLAMSPTAETVPIPEPAPAPADSEDEVPAKPDEKQYGEILLNDFRVSDARRRGCLFGIVMLEAGKPDYFAHRPYEEMQDLAHEDLNPMLFNATIRGRLEADDRGDPELILKHPQVVREYFELKEVDEREYSAEKFNNMVHDEYILIARLFIDTGLPSDMVTHLTGLSRFFPDSDEAFAEDPFPLERLAEQELIER